MNKTTRLLRPAIAMAALLSLAACSLTPDYQRPALAVPDQLPVPSAAATASAPASKVSELPWATYFPDARLQGLIRQALDQNRDLRVAVLGAMKKNVCRPLAADPTHPSISTP